ncbi:glycine-rich domain-containing protein [Sphingomonas sp. MMS12-HWE2-04]|uniref:glycine-rich domain-containing protein n=1 Tax=Sphingomonas sp. MMS12-HWE2-04 TaxID=3234199 RepID=UPI00384BB0F1
MRKAPGLTAETPDHPIWSALFHYTIGPQDAALPFAERLARENGWTRGQAEQVIEEYKRFCFLAVTAGHPVTPSDQVDQAWHLHLTYSRDYWDRFCPDVLGRPLHHGPTAGGSSEQHRFCNQYAETLRSYERVFGTPPADLWPDAARRLNQDHKARRVHPRDAIIVPRKMLGMLLLLVAALSALVPVLLLRS